MLDLAVWKFQLDSMGLAPITEPELYDFNHFSFGQTLIGAGGTFGQIHVPKYAAELPMRPRTHMLTPVGRAGH